MTYVGELQTSMVFQLGLASLVIRQYFFFVTSSVMNQIDSSHHGYFCHDSLGHSGEFWPVVSEACCGGGTVAASVAMCDCPVGPLPDSAGAGFPPGLPLPLPFPFLPPLPFPLGAPRQAFESSVVWLA
jgi:hypothetical protein